MNRHYECLVCGSKHIHLDDDDFYVCETCGARYCDEEITKCDYCDSDVLKDSTYTDKEGFEYCSEECRDNANGVFHDNDY